MDTDTCLPVAINSSQTCFLVVFGWLLTVLTRFLSAAGDGLCFLPHRVSDKAVPCTLNFILKCLCNNVLFQINAELLRLCHWSICGWVYSNGCIKQALSKWAQKSHQLLSVRITQRKLRGHATKTINTSFYNHLNWSIKLLYIYFWASIFGHIARRPIVK